MNSSDASVCWNTEYLCHPPEVSREYQEAYIIHCVAHTIMEQRDRATCTTGRPGRDGEALPVTPWERSEVNATGRYMQQALRQISERFPPTDWQAARRLAEQQSISVREAVSTRRCSPCTLTFGITDDPKQLDVRRIPHPVRAAKVFPFAVEVHVSVTRAGA